MTRSTGERLSHGRQAAATVVSPGAVVFVGTFVARGLGFLYPVVLARALDRAEFALAIFFINTGFFVGELVLTGFPTAMTRAIARRTDTAARGAIVLAALLGGAPLLAGSLVLGGVLALGADASPLLLAIVVVGLTVDAYYFAMLRGLQWFGVLAVYRVSANLAQVVVLAVAAALGVASLPLAVVVYAGTYLVPIAAIELARGPLVGLLAGGGRVTAVAARREIRGLVRFAVPALISGVAYGAVMGFDVFFVRMFAPEALADYGAARSLAVPMLLVPFSISVVLLPRAAAASVDGRHRLLGRALAIATGASVLGWAAWLVAGPTVVAAVFPPSYGAAVSPLGLLVPAVALVGVYSVLSQWNLGIGRPWPGAICLTAGAAVTVAGHLALTARLGAHGAAVAIGLGAVTALGLLGSYTFRTRDAVVPRSPA